MARRELEEINAGSMADIAFLLLIFFLVTTTMERDSGILRQLPPIVDEEILDPETVKERNVFEVLVNSNDQLLVENDFLEVDQLKDKAMMFLTNSGVLSDEPGEEDQTERVWVRKPQVLEEIGNFKGLLQSDPDNNANKAGLKKAEAKLDAINFFGEYKELLPSALISLKNDNKTSYEMYIAVQNELASALNELRDELAMKYSNKTYLELDEKDPEDKRVILAIRQIYPQRISEAEPNR